MRIFLFLLWVVGPGMCLLGGAERDHEVWASYRLGFVGADGASAAEAAMRAGAREAARELERQHRLSIELDFQAARRPDAGAQAAAMQRMFVGKVNGVALVPVWDPVVVDEVLFLTGRGIPVLTLVNDLPGAGTLAHIGSDEHVLGEQAMRAGLRAAGARRGGVALLQASAGNPNGALRLEGAKAAWEQAGRAGGLLEVLPGSSPGATLAVIADTLQQAGPRGIAGWVFLDEGPLTGADSLPWGQGTMGCVAIAEGPVPLHYLQKGQLDAVVMPDYFSWGKEAVRLLIASIHEEESPEQAVLYPEPVVIREQNLPEWRARWALWLR